jgi:hypothetical protein
VIWIKKRPYEQSFCTQAHANICHLKESQSELDENLLYSHVDSDDRYCAFRAISEHNVRMRICQKCSWQIQWGLVA